MGATAHLQGSAVLRDVPAPAPPRPDPSSGLQLGALSEGWCGVWAIMDCTAVPLGMSTNVTALVKVALANGDDDKAPFRVPADFVIRADCSGSMVGEKVQALRGTLLKARQVVTGRTACKGRDATCLPGAKSGARRRV